MAELERAMFNLTHKNTSRLTRILGGFILTIVMCIFITPGAIAGCNAKGKGKDCPPLNPPSRGDSVVKITGSLVHDFDSDNVARSCGSGADISNASGDYHCAVAPYNDSDMNTQGLVVIFNKKNQRICNSLAFQVLDNPATLTMDDGSFNYGWTDDCSNGCSIEVRMTFSGKQILDATDSKSDSLDVVLTGTIDTGTQDGNPFLVTRDVFIETMDFNFKKPGSNRTAGSCMFYSNPALTSPQIRFSSMDD